MTTYYVRTTGSNANAGTSVGAPWLTVKFGLATIAGGDTLDIGPGTFNEGNIYMSPAGSQVIPSGSGGSPTRVNGGGIGVTIIQGEFYLRALNYINFSSFTLDSTGHTNAMGLNGDMTVINFADIELKNADDSTFITNTPGGNMSLITWMRGSCHDGGLGGPSPGAPSHGMYWGGSGGGTISDVLVDGVELYNHNADSNAFALQIYSGGSATNTNFTIRNCRVRNNANGLVVGSGAGHLVYNNLIYDNGPGGGNGDGIEIGFGTSTDTKIYNNVFINNTGEGIQVGLFGSVANADITNNIFMGTTGIAIHVYSATSTTATTNIFYLNGGTTSGTITNSGNITLDPIFIDSTGPVYDFHLNAASPAIGSGTQSNALFLVDADGVTRGSTWDIGAYEFVTVAASTRRFTMA